MANANIAIININNTFDEWRIATNAVANDRNQLRNSYYVKDEGDLRVANGVLYLGPVNGGTAMVAEGNSNISIGNMTTTSNLTVLANASVGNLVINGNQTIVGDTLLDTDLLLLRANSSTDGPATIRARRTGTGNAELRFNNSSSVWQATSNAAVSYSTILTMANVENSTFSSSLSNVATAAAVATTYSLGLSAFVESQAAANSARVSQNSGSTINKASGINFVNTANVTIVVSAGTAGNANVEIYASGGGGSSATDAFNQANAAYAQANTATTAAASAANTVRVSANSSSTLDAKSLNFVNTATVGIVVSDAGSGIANVSFVSSGGGGGSVNSVSGTSGRITSTGGTDPVLDLATAGTGAASYSTGISALTVDAYGRVTSVTGSAGYVTSSGVTSVSGTTGRITSTGGATPIIDLDTAGAGAASYSSGISALTVDAYGRVTSVTGTANYLASNTDVLLNSLGVGTAASTTTGSIRATADIVSYYTSDRKFKENIRTIENALELVKQIDGVRYDWSEEYINKQGGEDGYFVRKEDVGVIAQDVQEVMPEVVAQRQDGTLAVRYEKLVPLLLAAIKELDKKHDDLLKYLENN